MDLKSYVDLKGAIAQAVQTYSQEVRNHQFSPA
jgi:ketopantoate hydroxymethyltransferase